MRKLKLEVNESKVMAPCFKVGNNIVYSTPPIDEDFWTFRVRLSDTQAMLGFPKVTTFGIGFAKETNWNTNLPYTTSAEAIYAHIKENKGDRSIRKADCIRAIQMIQDAIQEMKAAEGRASNPV